MPGESQFNVVLRGFVIDGFAKSLVVVELSELLNVSSEEAESYLKGNRKIIKAGVDAETAKKYHRMFTAKGVDVVVERVPEPGKPASKPADKPARPPSRSTASQAKPVAPGAAARPKAPTSQKVPQSQRKTVKKAPPEPAAQPKSQPSTSAAPSAKKPEKMPEKTPPRRTASADPEPTGPKISMTDAFSEEVEIPAPSLVYRIKLFATAAGVGALVTLYGLLLFSVLLFVLARFYSLLANVLSLGAVSIIIFYLLPIAAASILLIFLLRPLFPRDTRGENWFSLDATKEKTFVRFVQHISGLAGADKPESINITTDVKAFVDFEKGVKGIKQGRLELWIGIPLIISLSARQLAGVIAREFSHFNSGKLSKVAYLIHEVNIRLYNSVHDSDGWQLWFEQKAEQSKTWGILAKVARFFAQITGWLLTGFLFLVNAVSAGFLRQREFNGDYYNVLFAGTNAFTDTFKTKYLVEFALDDYHNSIFTRDAGNRLVNDLPALIFHDIHALDTEVVKHLEDDMVLASTQWKDMVPSNRDRIMQGEDLDLPGITLLDIPAYRLLREVKKMCYRATVAYYRERNIVFDPQKLVDVKEVAISSNEEKLRNEVCQQYYNGWFAPDVFWRLDQLTYAKSLQMHQRKKELNELIGKIRRRTPDFGQLKESQPQLFNDLKRLRLAVEIQKGGYALDLAAFGLEGVQPGHVQRIYKEAQQEYDHLVSQQNGLCEMMGLRLCLAVAFINDTDERKAAQYLVDALGCLQKYAVKMTELKIYVVLIPQYQQRVEKHKEVEHKKRLRRLSKEIQDLSKAIVDELRGYDWPFDNRYNNLAEYFLSYVNEPLSDNEVGIEDKARIYDSLWNALCRTNVYLNGQIAPLAQKAEKDNRIEPVKITAPART